MARQPLFDWETRTGDGRVFPERHSEIGRIGVDRFYYGVLWQNFG